MDFLTDDVIKANELTETQVSNIKQLGGDYVANLKKEWDGKANTNAEGIIQGAVDYTISKTGSTIQRNQGEKFGDFFMRLTDDSLSSQKAELDAKLKDFKGDDEYKSQIEALNLEKDELLKKYANFDEINTKAEKYSPLQEEYQKLKVEVAFNSIRPDFPQDANSYEVDAKWREFKDSVLKDYDLQIVDNKAIAVSKENIHSQKDLKDLLEGNEKIKELLTGRQQEGSGTRQTSEQINIEGVPFPVKKGMTSVERTQAIREYLAKEGLDTMHNDYPGRFQDLHNKIRNAK